MPQLRVAVPERQAAPVVEREPHPVPGYRRHFRPPAIHEAPPLVVAGPADAVARPDLDLLRLYTSSR